MIAKKSTKIAAHVFLLLGSVFMLFPFVWMFLTSIKTQSQAIAIPPIIFPPEPKWSNYNELFSAMDYFTLYKNTIFSTFLITIGQLFFCAMAAYAFARLEFPLKELLFVLILSVLMVPSQVFLLPQYIIIQKMGLLDSISALVIPNLFSAFGTFLLRQFFASLPKELEEAALLDGCSRTGILFKIIMPLSVPGLVSLSIFVILFGWNNLLWPMIVNTAPSKMTIPVGLSYFQGQFSTNYPVMMAGAFLAVIPLIILFLIFQKQFIEGIALSGTKG